MRSILSLLVSIPFLLVAQVQSPAEFLGYELGDKFTRHHRVVDYYKHLDQVSDKVMLVQYGASYEERPLYLAFVSTSENLADLETIRMDNLRRAGLEEGSPSTNIVTTWLSYNVHGNESSSTEASMKTVYELIRDGSQASGWLQNSVVVIDPCINPDGRERYVNFFWEYGNLPGYNPDPFANEHWERQPWGRTNHYNFDLNRDWAWLSQVESQHRIAVYNEWLPQIHVDFHEQGINSPYYFAPAAQPYHELITPFQRTFQEEIGRNHAKYFDRNNWFYFTRQFFDLLYPSYGDTYPVYNGSIGMTYEQAGHSRAGLGVIKQEGDTLTLKDRLEHHHTTGLSTVEMGSLHSDKLLSEFGTFFGDKPSLKYKTFVLKYPGDDDKFNQITDWLDAHKIRYGSTSSSKPMRGYNYATGTITNFSIERSDLVISTDQPKATFAHILFEPKTKLVDSITYDLTAWTIPYAYGLEAYASEVATSLNDYERSEFEPNSVPSSTYTFVSGWRGMADARFLASLLKADVKVRFSQSPLKYNGMSYKRGSLVIAKRDNKHMGDAFEAEVVTIANKHKRKLTSFTTGYMDILPDIGSSSIRYLKKPKVALIGGEGTSSLQFGATRHFLEQELQYPTTIIGTNYFSSVTLSEYDVILMQDGWYSTFNEREMNTLMDWVKAGGKLIAIEGAINKFKDSDYTGVVTYNSDEEESEMEERQNERDEKAKLIRYEDQERESMKNSFPKGVYGVKMDNSHPLAFGYEEIYYSLKTNSDRVAYLDENNVGIIESSEYLMSGFVGQYMQEDLEKSLVFGVEEIGRGQMVYMVDNPLFRSFWQNGKLLVANAIFLVGQ